MTEMMYRVERFDMDNRHENDKVLFETNNYEEAERFAREYAEEHRGCWDDLFITERVICYNRKTRIKMVY